MKNIINSKINTDRKGFTLIELLVVIAIIAILSTIGLTLFNGAQQNARDARRKSDIDAIAAALEAKREPGKSTYSAISATDFSSGVIPADTYPTQRYCIKLFNADADTADSAKTAPSGLSAWTSAGDGSAAAGSNVCPTTFWSVSANPGLFTTAATTTAQFTTLKVKSWTICALLENANASAVPSGWTNGVYCKTSAQ